MLGGIIQVTVSQTPWDCGTYRVEHDQVNACGGVNQRVLDAVLKVVRLKQLKLAFIGDGHAKGHRVVGHNVVLPVDVENRAALTTNLSRSRERD